MDSRASHKQDIVIWLKAAQQRGNSCSQDAFGPVALYSAADGLAGRYAHSYAFALIAEGEHDNKRMRC